MTEYPNQSQYPNGPDSDRPQHRPEGREHQVHKEILERRMRGGPEPTPDAYTHALEQWRNLPGSIVGTPTDITPPPTEEPAEPTDQENSTSSEPHADEQNDNDKE